MIKLDPRLQAAADLVLPGLPVADIGTDHAYLPVYLVERSICPQAVATDKAAAPIRMATDLIAAHGVSGQISLRCGDGLSVLKPGEAESVVLCGMGGLLMVDILENGRAILSQVRRLVLQPQSHIDTVRRWLEANTWRIVSEKIVECNGFFYVVMAAEPGCMVLSELEAEFGPCLLRQRETVFLDWLKRQVQERETICCLLGTQEAERASRRYIVLKEEIQRIQELIK